MEQRKLIASCVVAGQSSGFREVKEGLHCQVIIEVDGTKTGKPFALALVCDPDVRGYRRAERPGLSRAARMHSPHSHHVMFIKRLRVRISEKLGLRALKVQFQAGVKKGSNWDNRVRRRRVVTVGQDWRWRWG